VGDLYDAVFGVNATVTLIENVEIERLSSTAALTLQGAFTLDLNQGFDLNSPSGRTLSSSVVVNLLGGTSTFRGGGNLNMGSGAVLSNASVLEWGTDADFSYTGSTLPQFNNLSGATFRKTGGTDKTIIPSGYVFNNSGTIDIDSGQLELNGGTYNLNDGTAFTGTGLTRAVAGTFTLSGTLSADQNFEIAGANIGGTHTLSGGAWDWSSGTLGGPGTTTIASGATLELDGASGKAMNGSRILANQGTVVFGGTGGLTLTSGATVNNTGLFDIQSDADITYGGSTVPVINNLAGGTFRKSAAGANETTVGGSVTFNNGGTVEVLAGVLKLGGGGQSSGSFTVSPGATLEFNGGTHALGNGATFSGTGVTRLSAGTLSVDTASTATAVTFEQTGGTLGGDGTFKVSGTASWSGGTQGGIGKTEWQAGSVVSLDGSGTKTILNRTVENRGTATIIGSGGVSLSTGGVLDNYGVLDLKSDADFSYGGSTVPTFHNRAGAILRKSEGAGTTSIGSSIVFNNSGTIDIDSGTLDLNGGTYNLNDGTTFTGSSLTRFLSGTFNLNGTLTANNNTEFASANINGTHTLTGGNWDWTGGSLAGPGVSTLANGSTLELSGSATKAISTRTFHNSGTFVQAGTGNLQLDTGAILNNLGLIDVQTDADFVYGGSSVPTINNPSGSTFRKSGGAGTTQISSSIIFNNAGVIDVDSGQLDLIGGTYNLSDGTTFTGANLTRLVSGSFNLNGTLTGNNNVEIVGGSFSGTHTLSGAWDWTSGTIGGAGSTTLALGSTMELSGSSTKGISTRTFHNSGTFVQAGTGNIELSTGAILNNLGLIDVQTDADFVYGGSSIPAINNPSGSTFRKSGGVGTTQIGPSITLNNAGVIDVDSGQLDFVGGTYNLNNGTSFTGSSLTRFVSGSFNLNGTLTADNNVEIVGGSFSGTHTLSGTWDWTSGTIGGAGTTTLNLGSTLELSGAATKAISTRTLDIQGTVALGGSGPVQLDTGATVENHGLFEIRGDSDFFYGGSTQPKIRNRGDGTFRKASGLGTSQIGGTISFENAGNVTAQAGTLQFVSGTYTHSGGNLRVENGATIDFDASQTLAAGRVEGNGTFIVPTLNASGATIAPGLSAGKLDISGNLTLGALATLSIEIGGTEAGVSHDLLDVDGAVVAGGFLDVSLIHDFTPSAGMSFTVVDSTSTITGAFANAANGDRITFGGGASFVVSYGTGAAFPDRVILSDFAPVPEPGHWALLGGCGLLLFAGGRRLARTTRP